jgi:hypothetical protein
MTAVTPDTRLTHVVPEEILEIARQMDRDLARDGGIRQFPFALVSVSDGSSTRHGRMIRSGMATMGPLSVTMLVVSAGMRGLA